MNFACDCSASDKTFKNDVEDIRRSESCTRDAPIVDFDGETVVLIDFEREMNTLTTHTDDISLQFKTNNPNGPIFNAVSSIEEQFFQIALENGRIKLTTNINRASNINQQSEYFLRSSALNDNQWHTLHIRRRAQFIFISVDNMDSQREMLKVEIPKGVFNQVAQQIYCGGQAPDNFASPPYTNMAGFLPPGVKFSGQMRNFFWNEYDFFGTRKLINQYRTEMLTPRLELPTFPDWPRDPTYSITLKPNGQWCTMSQIFDVKQAGDMWILEFKTEYDGVLFYARDARSSAYIGMIILKGRLHVFYSIGYKTGVHEFPVDITDNLWHRVAFGFDRIKGRLILILDETRPELVGYGLRVEDIGTFKFQFGGIQERVQDVFAIFRNHAPTSLSAHLRDEFPTFAGCMGGFSSRSDKFSVDLFKKFDASIYCVPNDAIVRGFCQAVLRCTNDYCSNGGVCYINVHNELKCNCTNTGYCGERCEDRIISCPKNYCLNGGLCKLINSQPVCTCINNGYYGDRCQNSFCDDPNYCKNSGVCRIGNNGAYCDCHGTRFTGARCDKEICYYGYCKNGGQCKVNDRQEPYCLCEGTAYRGQYCDELICPSNFCQNGGKCFLKNNHPHCDCSRTMYRGRNCEDPICRPGYCQNNGKCVIQNGQPVCDCQLTNYRGEFCEQPLCPLGYCQNGGRCNILNGRPICDCSLTGYDGPNCQQPVCQPGYCLNDGTCSMVNGRPHCNCRNTGHTGTRCERPICQQGYCENNGRCTISVNGEAVCDCRNTGYTGDRCTQPVCSHNFCLHGGVCIPYGDTPRCNCSGTNYGGDRCHYQLCQPDYCLNGGRCFVRPGSQSPECDCSRVPFVGPRCQTSVCPLNYCFNGGICRPMQNRKPVCDCLNLGFSGERCENPICQPGYCGAHGSCVVVNGKPECKCAVGYWGKNCQLEVCTEGYCHNGGTCYAGEDSRPHCRCPIGYDGDQCNRPIICPSGYCFHGGVCTMNNGIPICDCRQTDYQGHRCDVVKTCPQGYCHNNGRCSVVGGVYVCDCEGTGYQGTICTEAKSCPANYCLNGGTCTVLPDGRYKCDCSRTGRSGPHCNDDTNGIYIDYEKVGYLVYTLQPPQKTTEDDVSIGFKTYSQSGTIFEFTTTDGKYWGVKLRDGRVVVNLNEVQYSYRPIVNDGEYHVVNIQRRKNSMVVTLDNSEAITLPMTGVADSRDNSLTHSHIYVGADHLKSDIFRGAIGGLYWNGRYIIDEAKGGLQIVVGDIIYVLLPSFVLPGKKIQPVCPVDYCFNGGLCYVEDYELKCDCRLIGWQGPRCERQTRGFLPIDYSNGAYVRIPIIPTAKTNEDRMRIAFQTYMKDGAIARFMSPDGRYYEIYLKGQQVFLSINNEIFKLISASYQQCDDGKMHVITLHRKGNEFTWTVDGHKTIYVDRGFVNSDGSLLTSEIIIGADRNFENTFGGVLGAFNWNGRFLINEQGELINEARIMLVSSQAAGSKEDVVIVLMPHILSPPTPVTPAPKIPFPDVIPPGQLSGGIIMDENGALLVPSVGQGGGAVGVHPGAEALLLQAGGGILGMVNPWLAGLLLLLLPLLSALIWACWRCKPGCCPPCLGGKGAGAGAGTGKVSSAMNRLASRILVAPEKDLIVGNQGGNATATKFGGGNGGYFGTGSHMDAHTKAGNLLGHGSDDRYDITTTAIRNEENIFNDLPNVYNADDLKVDCCVLTKNSQHLVTGSANGPPQIWDMMSGEPFKVMNGMELGCSDLHLACNDQILIGQVVDEMNTSESSKYMHRLQMWDFASGVQLGMPAVIMCSASCLTKSETHIVAARYANDRASILVWDLAGNQLAREIFYNPLNSKAYISYLNITHEDRIVVAGFTNPDDGQAYFMVFDLAADTPHCVQPKYAIFDAKPEATEILNNEEAVTGTRKGELIVWNLLTGVPVRQIMIHATLDSGNVTKLPPHTGTIHTLTLSLDKQLLVSGAEDKLVRVWSIPEEQLLHTLEGHGDDVLSVVISEDNEMIVSGSWDGSIRVWRVSDGSQMCWFTSNIEVLQVKLSRDKQAIVGLGERCGQQKLIMMQIVRNFTRVTSGLTNRNCPQQFYPTNENI